MSQKARWMNKQGIGNLVALNWIYIASHCALESYFTLHLRHKEDGHGSRMDRTVFIQPKVPAPTDGGVSKRLMKHLLHPLSALALPNKLIQGNAWGSEQQPSPLQQEAMWFIGNAVIA